MPFELIAQLQAESAPAPGPQERLAVQLARQPSMQTLNRLSIQAAELAAIREVATQPTPPPLVGDVPEEIQMDVRSRLPVGLGLGINI